MTHVGDIMSTLADVQYIGVFNINQRRLSICSPTWIMISPPIYSWYPSDVLNTPRCTHDIPHMNHGIPRCTEHPRCTQDISRCTEHTLRRVTTLIKKNTSLMQVKILVIYHLHNFTFLSWMMFVQLEWKNKAI